MPSFPPQSSYRYDPDRYEFEGSLGFGRHTRIKLFGTELDFQFSREEGGFRFIDEIIELQGILRRGADFTQVFDSFRPLLYQQTLEVFAAQGLPEPWPPLDPKYAAWKRKKFPGMPILQRTRRLVESLTGGPEGIWAAHPRTLEYGTMVPYFEAHQEGFQSLPQRMPLVLLPDTFEVMNRSIFNYVTTGAF